MRNPLLHRLPRELKRDFGRYLVLFLFLVGTIALVSGWRVAGDSMSAAYEESFDTYHIEDGNFALYAPADDALLAALTSDTISIHTQFYLERETDARESTLRIFQKRTEINLECLMEGAFPAASDEIAIDRMYADNNALVVGDTLTLEGMSFTICGFVALSDYSALFSSPSDMMFDAMQFGVAIVTPEAFTALGEKNLHYSYAWQYRERPQDDSVAKERGDAFLEQLSQQAALHGNAVTFYLPEYRNQAILFTGDDIKGDATFITLFLYIVAAIIAFIFAITTSNTITEEANVIGTLRATGYTKGELILHYMEMPLLVMLAAAIVGNVLGYTVFQRIAAAAYYGSYSLPTYQTRWNARAFLITTVIPLVILALINFVMLTCKLRLSPLQFIRRDLSRKKNRKAFRLNTKIGILHRFRLRVVFQNLPNYLTIFFGVFFANAILLFGMLFTPLLDKYQADITGNLLAPHQYLLNAPVETNAEDAEKFAAATLKTLEGKLPSEEITVYGLAPDSRYHKLVFGAGVYVSVGYAEKHSIHIGDTITLQEQFGHQTYEFIVDGIDDYPAALCVFLSRTAFNETFGNAPDAFNGYFSDAVLEDVDAAYIAMEITVDDLTKTSRQLKLSMGSLMSIFWVFGITMFVLIVYLLSKIVIEKNAQSIAMAKILGYENREINGIYLVTTTVIVFLSMLVTIPLANAALDVIFTEMLKTYAGWLPYYVAPSIFVRMAMIGILSYAVIAWAQIRRVKRIPLADALKQDL